MGKQLPVPDVEALRYKGTKDKPDIKIFVSHRIDQDSVVIDNPLYIPVRCGAVYDERKNVEMLGDDTGDNISEKRDSYCELTVQYWAWKNVKADYYGLCHYRRYISFAEKDDENVNVFNHAVVQYLDEANIKKYKLNSKKYITQVVRNYDIVTFHPMDLKLAFGEDINVYESLKRNPLTYDIKAIDMFLDIIKEFYPYLYTYAQKYITGTVWRAWNCYILRDKFFVEYSNILFNILSLMDRHLETGHYNQEQYRQPGYIGEILFPIYLEWKKKNTPEIKILERQLIKIVHPERQLFYYPKYESNNVAIVMASSDEYIPIFSVALESIIENTSESYNYDIIVLSNNICVRNKNIIRSMVNKENISIRFFDISNYLANRKLFTRDHVTIMTYVRLAITDICQNYDKVIYLDSDIIVTRDLAYLYNIDLKNYLIAAVRDTVMAGWCNGLNKEQMEYNNTVLKLKDYSNYFNGGVLLINVKKMKSYCSSEKLLDLAEEREWKWFDQDVLNVVCNGKTLILPNKWNYMAHTYSVQTDLSEYYSPLKYYKEYLEAQKDPWIIHYAGHFVPCFHMEVDQAEYFWKYARNTPFYEILLTTQLSHEVGGILYRLPFVESRVAQIPESVLDARSSTRKKLDRFFPQGTKRYRFASALAPSGSKRLKAIKKVYHLFVPYR